MTVVCNTTIHTDYCSRLTLSLDPCSLSESHRIQWLLIFCCFHQWKQMNGCYRLNSKWGWNQVVVTDSRVDFKLLQTASLWSYLLKKVVIVCVTTGRETRITFSVLILAHWKTKWHFVTQTKKTSWYVKEMKFRLYPNKIILYQSPASYPRTVIMWFCLHLSHTAKSPMKIIPLKCIIRN